MTFVCGTNEQDKLSRFAELCNMCITPLPGKLLAVFELVCDACYLLCCDM